MLQFWIRTAYVTFYRVQRTCMNSCVLNKLLPVSILTLNAAQVLKPKDNRKNEQLLEDIDVGRFKFSEELEKACSRNNEALLELIKTLNMCINEICEQYQTCIARQIEITLKCMSLEPIGKHWDDITKYRVEANDLKTELEKYGLLVERLGQMVHSQSHNYVILGKNEACCNVVDNYDKLKGFVLQKIEENKSWEGKLLEVNKESILRGIPK